jgi:hypothetical protein
MRARAPFLISIERTSKMKIQGRCLHPASLAERRVLKTLGVDLLRVRRGLNPFAVARQVKKLAAGTGGNLPALRAMLQRKERPAPVTELPDSTSQPRNDDRAA